MKFTLLRILNATIAGLFIFNTSSGQVTTVPSAAITLSNPDRVPVTLLRISPALKDMPEQPPTFKEFNAPRPEHDNPSLEHPMPRLNPDALPNGEDLALQKDYNYGNERKGGPMAATSILSNWSGLTAA